LQGVIVFAPGNKQFKILHEDYLQLFRARGNEPSIKFRYLQVRMDKRSVDMLCYLYPNMRNAFEEYENILYSVARMIHYSYVQRHIKGLWSTLPTEEYKVDCACHSWHEEDRKSNRVTLGKVIEVLNEQTPTNLNRMIRRFTEEQRNRVSDTTEQENSEQRTDNRNNSGNNFTGQENPDSEQRTDNTRNRRVNRGFTGQENLGGTQENTTGNRGRGGARGRGHFRVLARQSTQQLPRQ